MKTKQASTISENPHKNRNNYIYNNKLQVTLRRTYNFFFKIMWSDEKWATDDEQTIPFSYTQYFIWAKRKLYFIQKKKKKSVYDEGRRRNAIFTVEIDKPSPRPT